MTIATVSGRQGAALMPICWASAFVPPAGASGSPGSGISSNSTERGFARQANSNLDSNCNSV